MSYCTVTSSIYFVIRLLRKTHCWSSSMHLQGSDGGHQHHHVGPGAGVATLDVEELLHADVGTEASLHHCGHKGQFSYRITAVRNNHWITEPTCIDENMSTREPFSRLHLPTKPSGPTSFKAILSAWMEELPWAMLANGPAWTNTGVPCRSRRLTCDTKPITQGNFFSL